VKNNNKELDKLMEQLSTLEPHRNLLTHVAGFIARKSSSPTIQLLASSTHGLISIFGVGGAVAVLMAARRKQMEIIKQQKENQNHAVKETNGKVS
jgi:hypothetical protein